MPLPSPNLIPDDSVSTAAHIVQTALTPVFLLNGIGTLLALFNTRLARVSDHIEHTDDLLKKETDAEETDQLERHLVRLRQRVFLLDASVALAAAGGAATCGSVFVLFLGDLKGSNIGAWLIGIFSLALACTIGSLVAFFAESLIAWHTLRREGPVPRSTKASKRSA